MFLKKFGTTKFGTLGVLIVDLVPIVLAGTDRTLSVGVHSTHLNGTATDPEGHPLTVLWTVQSGLSGAAIDPATEDDVVTTATGLRSGGVYVFRLTASDGTNTVYDEVTITVPTSHKKAITNLSLSMKGLSITDVF